MSLRLRAASFQSFRYTSARILRHPANRGRRGRAFVLYLAWQFWERAVRRPWTIRLGDVRRIRLYPHSVVAAFVLYYRVPDYEDLSFIRAYLCPGDLFVDVGANIGVYSLWATETDEIDVVAFEPSSVAHERLVENVELNDLTDRVQVHRKAVGAEPRVVRLTTGQDALNRVLPDGGSDTEPVEQTTLDKELDSEAPVLVKIDVEGGELDVLTGARATILRHRPALIIEANDPDRLTRELEALGYRMWSYNPARRALSPAVPHLHGNVLALADVDATRRRLMRPLTKIPNTPPADQTRLPHGLKAALLNLFPFLRLLLLRRDFLLDSGWLASGRQNAPVGRDGHALPWYTYPAIDFLQDRLRSDMTVFEYGSGNSTRWWASRVAHVAAVESDPKWIQLLTPTLSDNTDLRFEPAGSADYTRSATQRGRKFDIVVIDGMDRTSCAFACLPALKDDGIVIWDNSDWVTLWDQGMNHLSANGFRRIDFRGLGPLNWRPWTTSIFYRPGKNCLDI